MVSVVRLCSIGMLLFLNVYVYSAKILVSKCIEEVFSDDGGIKTLGWYNVNNIDKSRFYDSNSNEIEDVLSDLINSKGYIKVGESKQYYPNYGEEDKDDRYSINIYVMTKKGLDEFMEDSKKFDNVPVLKYPKGDCTFGELRKELSGNGEYLFYKTTGLEVGVDSFKSGKRYTLGVFVGDGMPAKDVKFFVCTMHCFKEEEGEFVKKDEYCDTDKLGNEVKKAISDYKAAQSSGNPSNPSSSNNSNSSCSGSGSGNSKKKKCCCC